ncbi:hypothetical protein Zmor_009831 [Zophobas morio]|uniref:Uncharacterized protein n=1 Tax=Zophobas morio TaxID=2755281 RepID=A0AA38MIY8_9CUCU|nr:hypothetical protein Zmor_009807 [Zophobas morio]KAJ3658065.1 hypothetical protein Zmor_009831 [Zophobas morio]
MRLPLVLTPIYKKRFPSGGTHTLSMNWRLVGTASQNCANGARLAAYSTSCRPIGGRIRAVLIQLLCMRELLGHITSGGCYAEILPLHTNSIHNFWGPKSMFGGRSGSMRRWIRRHGRGDFLQT